MARLLLVSIAVLVVVIMLSSESKSLRLGENPPALTFDRQYRLTEFLKNEEKCKEIGERCYKHEQCCSRRCLHYLAKCVS